MGSQGKNTGVGSHSLLQEIFPTQGLKLGLLSFRQILYQQSEPPGKSQYLQVYMLFCQKSCRHLGNEIFQGGTVLWHGLPYILTVLVEACLYKCRVSKKKKKNWSSDKNTKKKRKVQSANFKYWLRIYSVINLEMEAIKCRNQNHLKLFPLPSLTYSIGCQAYLFNPILCCVCSIESDSLQPHRL